MPFSEDEELSLLLSPERNLRPADGLLLEPVVSFDLEKGTSDPAPILPVRLTGGSFENSAVNRQTTFGETQ